MFEANFYRLSLSAVDIAKERSQVFTEKFLDSLNRENPQGINSASDPDMQYSVSSAQHEYAKTGNEDTLDLLIELLVKKSISDKSSLYRILLDEALKVCPKLLINQLSLLSLVLMLKYVEYDTQLEEDIIKFSEFLDKEVYTFAKEIPKTWPHYWHLREMGCLLIRLEEKESVLGGNFGKLVVKALERSRWEPHEANFLIQKKIC